MKAEIKEIEIEAVCLNGDCGSNEFATLNDPYNQDLFETLKPLIDSGWIFKQDANWKQQYPNRPKSLTRGLLCFCSDECYQEWLKNEGYEQSDWCDAGEDLKHFEVKFDELVIER